MNHRMSPELMMEASEAHPKLAKRYGNTLISPNAQAVWQSLSGASEAPEYYANSPKTTGWQGHPALLLVIGDVKSLGKRGGTLKRLVQRWLNALVPGELVVSELFQKEGIARAYVLTAEDYEAWRTKPYQPGGGPWHVPGKGWYESASRG